MRAFFEGTRPGRAATWGTAQLEMPILYFRDDAFAALFTADLAKLRDAMPSDHLHPISVGRGRGLLMVACFDYLETSAGPYGEVAVTVPTVYGARPPPLLPALFEARWPGSGHLVLHLPVTRRLARDAGRGQWGYTKFIADMEFQNTPEHHECRLDEGGAHILTLKIAKRGLVRPDRKPIVTYSVKDRELIRTTIPQVALARTALGAGGSALVLGDTHPVAWSLRDLGVGSRPLLTRYYVERSAILAEGEVIERDVRPLDGYLGTDREEGVLHAVRLPAATVH
jgi:hypothetical protein